MEIIIEVKSILENEGYSLYQDSENIIIFEDESLCGFVSYHTTIKEILEQWQSIQDKFIKNKTFHLRQDFLKAFNIYSVFLTTEGNIINYKNLIINIQENFRSSRKIIGYGINTNEDVRRTLFPLLSIQKKSVLDVSDYLLRIKSNLNVPDIISEKSIDEIYNKIFK